MPLHLKKLAVGIDDLDHLRRVVAARAAGSGGGSFPIHTRHAPTRAAEIRDGGSLYWVIRGVLQARQRVSAFEAAVDGEGRACCRIILAAEVVETEPTLCRPFQGWRYLIAADAPADRAGSAGEGIPPHLAAELRALGLL